MHQQQEPVKQEYPIGRGYGHDYMRGGEVLGGYGYSEREDYERPRGEQKGEDTGSTGSSAESRT
ncbi:MAG: hypothetical protein IT359_06920 [Gemmatimonadaceae bacterium]|nr:hypothetical protein [Gemmatimonadaceae bacterium]